MNEQLAFLLMNTRHLETHRNTYKMAPKSDQYPDDKELRAKLYVKRTIEKLRKSTLSCQSMKITRKRVLSKKFVLTRKRGRNFQRN